MTPKKTDVAHCDVEMTADLFLTFHHSSKHYANTVKNRSISMTNNQVVF